jgi:hypothetical protein
MTTSDNSETNIDLRNYKWFGDSIHYWTHESLQFAYAFACVDVAIIKSIKARRLYVKIVESWNNPQLKETLKDFYDEMTTLFSDEQKELIRQVARFPERYMEDDLDKSLKPLKDVAKDEDVGKYVLDLLDKPNLIEKHGEFPELIDFIALILEFVFVGFNRKTDIKKGKYKIVPGNNNSWLMQSILFMTAMVHYKLTMNRVIQMYKIRIYRKKIVNFEDVLCKQPTSRMHRRIIVDAKNAKLFLVHDAKVYQTAERWYQCRVVYSGPEEFCRQQLLSNKEELYPASVNKEIRECDEAMGYPREKTGKRKK